ncbi:glyoxylate/hydroxypyruvate reductase A, partial [Clostridioides difficile]|nr:glyoxylate/hydroxypyruvate reductase A [Clostridioides difficile]
MKILFHSPHQEAGAWRDAFAQALPEAQLRAWQPGDTAPADYARVWRAPREFFAPRDGLRAIFHLGAGVDALLALEHAHPVTLPQHVPLVRLEDSG